MKIKLLLLPVVLLFGCTTKRFAQERYNDGFADGVKNAKLSCDVEKLAIQSKFDSRLTRTRELAYDTARESTNSKIVSDLEEAARKYPKSAVFLNKIANLYKEAK